MTPLDKATDATEVSPSVAAAPTMRAIVQDRYGSADALELRSVPRPAIAADEVLVQVRAAGLSRATWHLMTGTPYAMRAAFGLRGPKQSVIGQDVAGTVVGIGADVERFAIGDEVFGVGHGTFAEYAVASPSKLTRKPANVSFVDAAAAPVPAITAMQAVRAAGIEAGQRVLVSGAAGGVGSYIVQLAKAAGAEVTGVCSTSKIPFVRQLGADHVSDYTNGGFPSEGGPYDVILDVAGNPSLAQLRGALTPNGAAIIVGGEGAGEWLGMGRQLRALVVSPFIRQRLVILMGSQPTADLDDLASLLADGTLLSRVDKTFPLEHAADAMRYFESGRVQGKVVITV